MFTIRWLKVVVGAVVLVAAAVITTDHLGNREIRRLQTRIDALAAEKAELMLFAERLSASRRVAQINVEEQSTGDDGLTITVLRWQQIGPSGKLGPPEIVTLKGDQVYVEAMVVKFMHDLVGRAAKDRETSLVMFRRAFGDRQAPYTGQPLDQTAPMETASRPEPDAFHERLWRRFHEIVADPQEAEKRYGVRVAQFEAPSVPMKKGQVWEAVLDQSGGLNLRLLDDEPAKRPDAAGGG